MVNAMKVYLTTFYSSEGAVPSTVVERLVGINFEPVRGTTDFVRTWDKGTKVESIIWSDFQDFIHGTLRGCQVLFAYKTVPD